MIKYTDVTDAQIREYLGHGVGSRRVRVKKNGEVHYSGSTSDTDRSHDYWHFGGWRADLACEVADWLNASEEG
jgi:hypothetical protein